MVSLSRDEVRAIDRFAIETLGVPGMVLMENAGRQVADAVADLLGGPGGLRGRSVAVVTGSGNNGGDGFVVARHLSLRGVRVAVFMIAPAEKLTGDAAANNAICVNMGQDLRAVGAADLLELAGRMAGFDAVVDAVGGTGIRGVLRGEQAEAVEQINAAARPVVAVDIPTGLDCDTGLAAGPTVRAAITVTFVARKKGFDNPASREYTGEVRVADIGIPAAAGCREGVPGPGAEKPFPGADRRL
jgi:NAD(P)H-hydrate epimerase